MALSNKRIIDLPERSALNSDDYTVVDGSNGGTGKYKLSQLQDDVGEVEQDVAQLSQTVTAQGTQVAQNTDEIADLKAEIDASMIISDITELTDYSQGSINPDTGENATSSYWCRTLGYRNFDADIVTITISELFHGYYCEYSGESASNFVKSIALNAGASTQIVLTSGHLYRITIERVDQTPFAPADIPVNAVVYKTAKTTDRTLTYDGKPADAKAVGKITSALVVNNTLNVEWQNKTINGTSGAETVNSKRISTVDFIDSKYMPYMVSVPDGMQYSLRYYSSPSSDAIIGTTSWMTEEDSPEIQNGQYFKVVASYTNSDVIDYTEGSKVTINYESQTDKSLTKEDKCADAKAVGVRLEALENGVSSGIVARNNTAETVNKLQQLTQIPRTGSSTYGTKPLCLLHFSDLHNDEQRLKNIVAYADYYADYLDDIINTGDTVLYRSSDGLGAWNNVDGTEKILNTIGNHDTRVADTWIGQTEAESYAMYFAPYILNWNVTNYSASHCYYYKDYATEKVRLIVLDIMHQTAEQLSWFESALASALSAELHVIVAVHSRAHWLYESYQTPWDDKPVVAGYASGYIDTSSSPFPENLSDDYADAVDSFIADGGFFIAWIHGHTHFKMFAKLQTHPNQLDVSVANAGIVPFAKTYVNNRVAGSKSEDSFNVLAIDTTSKILRILAVGATYDRYMRLTDTISYNYETHGMLYSN